MQLVGGLGVALQAQIKALDKRADALLAASQALKQKVGIMRSVKGVGSRTAITLLAAMPELGALTRRQAASLAGCAPHPDDTGKSSRHRSISGGRSVVRKALYMAALSAARFNPDLKEFYDRLIKKGKKPLVALAAVMRKLITILNAKLRDAQSQTTW